MVGLWIADCGLRMSDWGRGIGNVGREKMQLK